EVGDLESEAAEVFAEKGAEGTRFIGDRGGACRGARLRSCGAARLLCVVIAVAGNRLQHHLITARRAGDAHRCGQRELNRGAKTRSTMFAGDFHIGEGEAWRSAARGGKLTRPAAE